jgi:hypothetical protein
VSGPHAPRPPPLPSSGTLVARCSAVPRTCGHALEIAPLQAEQSNGDAGRRRKGTRARGCMCEHEEDTKGRGINNRDVGACEVGQACSRARAREPREATRLTADAMNKLHQSNRSRTRWGHTGATVFEPTVVRLRTASRRRAETAKARFFLLIVDGGSQRRPTIVGRGGHSSTLLIDSLAVKGAASVGLHWGSWQNPLGV